MSNEEFKKIIILIESNYQNFKLEDYTMKYWYEQLKLFDYNDVRNKILQHFDGEYANTYPKLAWITKGLNTVEQKLKQGKMYIKCPMCKKKYEYPGEFWKWKKCHDRCNMIENIINKSIEYNIDIIDVFGKDISEMSLTEIDEKYIDFLHEVYKKNESKISMQEKDILKHIFDTDPKKNKQIEF